MTQCYFLFWIHSVEVCHVIPSAMAQVPLSRFDDSHTHTKAKIGLYSTFLGHFVASSVSKIFRLYFNLIAMWWPWGEEHQQQTNSQQLLIKRSICFLSAHSLDIRPGKQQNTQHAKWTMQKWRDYSLSSAVGVIGSCALHLFFLVVASDTYYI